MTDNQFKKAIEGKKERHKKMMGKGYIKTTLGWVNKNAFTHCESEGLIIIKDKTLHYTQSGVNIGIQRISQYLMTGNENGLTS